MRVCGFCDMPWEGGWGISHPAHGIDEKFCGRACCQAWEQKMSFTHFEIRAIETMLPAMGEYVATSGIMNKPFAECSRDEILGLFAATVKNFRDQFGIVLDDAEVPY